MKNKVSNKPHRTRRNSLRLKGYDYSREGLYFVTLCCQNRHQRFGRIENGKMIVNEFGEIAHNEWLKTPEKRDNVELGEFIIMPDHIHGIIRIVGGESAVGGELHSPQLGVRRTAQMGVRRTAQRETNEPESPPRKSDESSALNRVSNDPESSPNQSSTSGKSDTVSRGNEMVGNGSNEPESGVPGTGVSGSGVPGTGVRGTPQLRAPSKTVGAIIRGYKSAVTRQVQQLGFKGKLWQRNYYDHIIRTEEAYINISKYIKNNPSNWGKKKKFKQ
jgi:putative transposase